MIWFSPPSLHLSIPLALSLTREGHLQSSPTATWCVPEWAQKPGAEKSCAPVPFVQTWYLQVEWISWGQNLFGTFRRLTPSRSFWSFARVISNSKEPRICKGLLWGRHGLSLVEAGTVRARSHKKDHGKRGKLVCLTQELTATHGTKRCSDFLWASFPLVWWWRTSWSTSTVKWRAETSVGTPRRKDNK